MSLVFLAISRTGPDPMRHDMFEVAAISRRDNGGNVVERVRHWAIAAERLAGADPEELLRTAYYDRSGGWTHHAHPVVAIDPTIGTTTPATHGSVARELAKMLLGAQLATFGIDREGEFVGAFLRSQREAVGWVGHFDVTAAAAGGLAGYSQGWTARGRAVGAAPAPSSVDLTAALPPLDPFRLAVALGAKLAGPPVSALTRVYLARDMYAIITSPLVTGEPEPAAGAHAGHTRTGESELPTVAMAAMPPTLPPGVSPYPHPGAPSSTGTGDVDLDQVISGIDDPLR